MSIEATIESDRLRIGEAFFVAFQRTLRIPDDGRRYPLPPGLGRLPLRQPGAGRHADGPPVTIVPLRSREALWLGFDAPVARPRAVLVGLGKINAITGAPWSTTLTSTPQNYLVCPPQLWLDGVKVGHDGVRQFVATPLGTGTTIEAQLSPSLEEGTLRIVVFEPRPGHFDEAPLPSRPAPGMRKMAGGMGLGAGGQIRQRLYPDPHGLETWNPASGTEVLVRLVGPAAFRTLAGEAAPPSPIDADTYTLHGYPWFDLYGEPEGDLPPTTEMERIRSVGDLTGRRADDRSIDIPDAQITRVKRFPDD